VTEPANFWLLKHPNYSPWALNFRKWLLLCSEMSV